MSNENPADPRNITTQSLLAIEHAAQALSATPPEEEARSPQDLAEATRKLRAYYARERGLKPPEVTLELLRQRHARRRRQQDDP